MALTVTHAKVSAITDNAAAAAAGEVLPSDWNALHVVSGDAELIINTTPIVGGTDTRVLFDKAGVVGESAGLTFNYTDGALDVDSSTQFGQVNISGVGDGTQYSFFSLSNDVNADYWVFSHQVGGNLLLFTPTNNVLTLSQTATRASFGSTTILGWASTADSQGAVDSTLQRIAAATLQTDNFNVTSGHTYQHNNINALFSVHNVAADNWFIGAAGNLTVTGDANMGMGANALVNITIGSENTAIGVNAGFTLSSGNNNICIGTNTMLLAANNNMNYNVVIGHAAGLNITSDSNTIIGGDPGSVRAGNTIIGGGQNIVIGAGCDVPSASANGQLSIGNYIYGTGLTGTGSTISTGWLGIGVKAAYTTEALGVNGTICTNAAAFILQTKTSITGGSTGNVPTLTGGPVTGNPTKWLPYDDNGTTRYIPSW